jgi:CRISPR/Cas system CSM-associated protein Csm3 (group 7 of RAMP superfamily)
MNTEEIATEIAKIQEADKKEDQEENKNSKKEKKETKDQMIYYFEVMSIGTALTHTLRLEYYSDLQLSALGAAMARFKNLSPYIGGKKTMGCGRVKIKYDELPDKSLYEEYLDKHKKEIKNLLMTK